MSLFLYPMDLPAIAKAQAIALKAAKLAKGTMTWPEVEKTLLEALLRQSGDAAPITGTTHADFGDRKQIPPTAQQVTAYSVFIGYPLDGQAWCDAYETKGWKVGKERMKDWQAAVRTWRAGGYGQGGIAKTIPTASTQRNYTTLS